MTFEEAHAAMIESKKKWGGGSSEAWLINALVSVGVLELDKPKPTLWELLRAHGIAIDVAQSICNAAMLKGVSIPIDGPRSPEATET